MTISTAGWYSLLTLLCVVLPHPSNATNIEVDWPSLLRGEVVVESVQNPEGIPGVQAMFVVTAPRERIWSVLVDYENFPHIFPSIKKMRVLKHDEQGAKVEFWTPVAFIKLNYVVYRHYVEPGRYLTWTRLAGDMERIEGGWEIRDTPRPGVHLLIYKSYVDFGGLIPAKLIRRSALRRTRDMGERVRAWIENHPEIN